jgi:membrane protein
MGAALAYYTVFSVAPLLVISIAAGLLFGQEAAQSAILEQAQSLVGEKGAGALEGLLHSAQKPKEGTFATILGVVAFIINSTTVFAELGSSLNRIWKAAEPDHSGLLNFLRTRVLSFGLVLVLGFLLIVAMVVTTAVAALGKYWDAWPGDMEILLQIVNFIVPFSVITVMFAMIYRFLPNIQIRGGTYGLAHSLPRFSFPLASSQ